MHTECSSFTDSAIESSAIGAPNAFLFRKALVKFILFVTSCRTVGFDLSGAWIVPRSVPSIFASVDNLLVCQALAMYYYRQTSPIRICFSGVVGSKYKNLHVWNQRVGSITVRLWNNFLYFFIFFWGTFPGLAVHQSSPAGGLEKAKKLLPLYDFFWLFR